MAAVGRAMTLSQNYHHQLNGCIIVAAGPDTPPPSSAGSPPLMINTQIPAMPHHTMLGKRTIAPAMMSQQQQQHHHIQQQHQMKGSASPVIRFSGSDVKNTTGALKINNSENINAKRMNYNHQMTQYSTGPMPSVERRNARERNRVKQVNNGFDKLRQYIPSKIVEVENGGRGVSKKLSKVDTLKLAVKYIQRLKEMLDENDSRLPQTSEVKVNASGSMSSTSSYYSASPAPAHLHPMHMTYASTPISSYQENHHLPTCSEPSVSPAPSYHSDVSSVHQQPQVYLMPNAQFPATTVKTEEGSYPQAAYNQIQFVDEDSGSFEEDGILDDILHWQLQN